MLCCTLSSPSFIKTGSHLRVTPYFFPDGWEKSRLEMGRDTKFSFSFILQRRGGGEGFVLVARAYIPCVSSGRNGKGGRKRKDILLYLYSIRLREMRNSFALLF